MFEFYEFNTVNICIVLGSTFIIYYILTNYLNFENTKDTKDNKDTSSSQFSLEYLIISILISVIISMIISYFITAKDESIMTDNFWDPIVEESK